MMPKCITDIVEVSSEEGKSDEEENSDEKKL